MTTYTLRSDDGEERTSRAQSLEDARLAAHQWATDAEYDDLDRTIWVDTEIILRAGGEDEDEVVETVTTEINPPAPKCTDTCGHSWHAPHREVGGLAENPGVYGHGGGVVIHEVCRHCGTRRITDTWAEHGGEQGLTSVSYRAAEEE